MVGSALPRDRQEFLDQLIADPPCEQTSDAQAQPREHTGNPRPTVANLSGHTGYIQYPPDADEVTLLKFSGHQQSLAKARSFALAVQQFP
jgi:hypothetical protein